MECISWELYDNVLDPIGAQSVLILELQDGVSQHFASFSNEFWWYFIFRKWK